jgi:hypothetical protein
MAVLPGVISVILILVILSDAVEAVLPPRRAAGLFLKTANLPTRRESKPASPAAIVPKDRDLVSTRYSPYTETHSRNE